MCCQLSISIAITNMKHLFVSSDESLECKNNTYDFTITLLQTLNGQYEIALGDITHASHVDNLYVFCELCKCSYMSDRSLPILGVVSQMGEFAHLHFHNVSRQVIQRILISITNTSFETLSQDIGPVRCTLLLKLKL